MSKMQISLEQSEILKSLRSILNCQNYEIIYNVTKMKAAAEEANELREFVIGIDKRLARLEKGR